MLTETVTLAESLQSAIDAEPFEVVHQLALADLLEESGCLDRSRALREMAEAIERTGVVSRLLPMKSVLAWKVKRHTGRMRKVYVRLATFVEAYGTHWEGGSKSTYYAVDLLTGESKHLPGQGGNPFTSGPIPTYRTDSRTVIVETGYFCGKPSAPRVHLHPSCAALALHLGNPGPIA